MHIPFILVFFANLCIFYAYIFENKCKWDKLSGLLHTINIYTYLYTFIFAFCTIDIYLLIVHLWYYFAYPCIVPRIQNFAYPVRQDLSCMFLHTLCILMHIVDWRFVLIYQLHINACMKYNECILHISKKHILCKMHHFASNVHIMCTNMKKKTAHNLIGG